MRNDNGWIEELYSRNGWERIVNMLRYHWNDFMISGQLGCDRIVIDAVPINVRNISGEEEGIQHIEKTFQGEITSKLLNKEISQEWKHMRNIQKMYQYLSNCINQAEKSRIEQSQTSKSLRRIVVSRQWCTDEGSNNKKRLIVKILLSDSQGIQVKQEQPQWLVIKLKEVYLTINGLLFKCNTVVLSELDYLRQMEVRQTEKMNELYSKMQEKMKLQLDLHKEELKSKIQATLLKIKDKSKDNTSSTKQKRSKKRHQSISEEIKYEEETSFEPRKQGKRRQKTIETLSQIKSQTEIKYQQDQQGLRLKLLQQSQPQNVTPIPIQFDQENPAYHFFLFSDKSAKKMGGFDYPMAILKHIIPKQGTHGAIINYAQQKSRRLCCLQIGIIDENIKKLLHSSVSDNYVFFKFNISTVCTKVNGVEKKKRFKRLRVLTPGESVELRVNLKLGIISWAFSYGITIRSEIPAQLRKMSMQPFVGIFATGDMVRFQDYLTQSE